MKNIQAVIFDWGDTLMRNFPQYTGPMATWPQVQVIPGVPEVLKSLSKKYICCVASNAGDSDADLLGKALERGGIRNYFRHCFTSKELGYSKPDPNFYREISNRLSIKAEACVMVGNNYEKDIIPAKSVGMGAILYVEGYDIKIASCADAVITSMVDLDAALTALGKAD